jgi:hypothetical protein
MLNALLPTLPYDSYRPCPSPSSAHSSTLSHPLSGYKDDLRANNASLRTAIAQLKARLHHEATEAVLLARQQAQALRAALEAEIE